VVSAVSVEVKTMSESRKVVVLGTGGTGLTAAVAAHDFGAAVQVFEKADKVGGTTAWSGGMVWIPNNHLERQAGVADTRHEAVTYLMSMSHGLIERHLAEAFVDAGPQLATLPVDGGFLAP
jgi:succinate dehydrogenase/fumarate reductase flavoprotein subunit